MYESILDDLFHMQQHTGIHSSSVHMGKLYEACSNLVLDLNYNRFPFISNDTKYKEE